MEGMARPNVTSDDPQKLERGIATLQRMDKLPGITQSQRQTLKSLQAEVAYYQARQRLDDARKAIHEAMTELKTAADSPSHNARAAHQMVSEVEPPAAALEEALRRAVHAVGTPEPAPPAAASEAPAAKP